LRTTAELDYLSAAFVNLDGDTTAGFTPEVVEREKDPVAGASLRDETGIVRFHLRAMLLDHFDIVVELFQQGDEVDAGLSVGEELHAAAASRNRSK
jgi:hypothetical protein